MTNYRLVPNPKLVARKFGVQPEQVTGFKTFQYVWLVKIENYGCRFVSFKMGIKAPAPVVKNTPKPVLKKQRMTGHQFTEGLVYKILRTHENRTSVYLGHRLIRVLAEDLATGERDWFSTHKSEGAEVGQYWRQSNDPMCLIPLSRDPELEAQVKALSI